MGHPSEKYDFVNNGMIRNPIFLGKFQIDGNQSPPINSDSNVVFQTGSNIFYHWLAMGFYHQHGDDWGAIRQFLTHVVFSHVLNRSCENVVF